ncbi:hypothetical protein CTAYLR_000346 [Chrysophaeum taylorii]|uniref:OTU domain-containing protein n=1 Tax=Chrysophaeum taylorii TaxID=2483200 RepID=A0AAD7XN41_9STRA|nr:hypothetical protein CTAYLR_000346 [Chrysophaeum taylorii]
MYTSMSWTTTTTTTTRTTKKSENESPVGLRGGEIAPTNALERRLSSDHGLPERVSPRTFEAPPPEAKVVEDHRTRLRRRLEELNLREFEVRGDGACQFRALAHQLYGDEELHGTVRSRIATYLEEHADKYGPFVDDGFERFVERMRRPEEWGDHVTLQAAADHFGVRVCLVTSYETRAFVHVVPPQEEGVPTVWLSFWAEVHYNSLLSYEDHRLSSAVLLLV